MKNIIYTLALLVSSNLFGQTFDWINSSYYTTSTGSQAITSNVNGLIVNVYHTHPNADLIFENGFIYTDYENSNDRVVFEFQNGIANIVEVNMVSKPDTSTGVVIEYFREDNSFIVRTTYNGFTNFVYNPYQSAGQGILQVRKINFDFRDNNWMIGAISYDNEVLSIDSINFSQFDIFPNPTSNIINIKGIENCNLSIFNTLGQIMLQAYNTKTIDVSSLPIGVYLIKISDGENSSIKKFIKN